MAQGSLIHVAYAEDHTLMRKGVISILESTGTITVDIEAENGQELLDKLELADVLPQICIIDINMPVMDGYTALQEIRKRWPDMKTLVLTIFDSDIHVIRMMLAGANGYLLKKCSENDICDAIASIQENGYYYSECANSALFHLIKTKSIKIQQFTDNEMEYLKYCCTELNLTQIAEKMGSTQSKVEGYRDRLYTKLNLKTRVELALFAVSFGIVPLDVNNSGNAIISSFKTK